MRVQSRYGLGMMAVACCTMMASGRAIAAEHKNVSAEAKRLLPAPDHVILASELDPSLVQQLPSDTPIRRYHIGPDYHGVMDGGTSGATGTEVYKNTMGTNFFAPGTNVQVADDILTIAVGGCGMSWVEILVTGGGNGTGPGFNVTFALLTACPSQGGTVIPGTQVTEMLPDNGAWLVNMDLEAMLVNIPPNPWLRVSFSNATAGWVFGRPAEIGFTQNLFHHPMFPCTAWFGGAPYAGFYADVFCGGDVETQFEAYGATAPSGFFDELALTDMWADDVNPITAPGNCDFVRFDSSVYGAMGAFTMKVELFTNDMATNKPLAPVMGTAMNCNGAGTPPNGTQVTCTKTVFPAITISTPQFWVTYDTSTHPSGPILVADFPEVGDSEDGFSIFGNPDAGQWSGPVWFYGGCPATDDMGDPVPCGTFENVIYCAGSPPVGACCDVSNGSADSCTDNAQIVQCQTGRWMNAATCAADLFDPPCGTSSCCKSDGSCENLTDTGCATAAGAWQTGQFCEDEGHTCPPGACITATNACSMVNDNAGGCADLNCCQTVCNIDSFCCDTAWDESCVNNAASFCEATAPNDACNAAIAIADGTINFDTSLATTDGPTLPDSCNKGFGVMLGKDIWYNFTAPMTGMTTVTLCDNTAYDSRIAVYTGCTCPVANAAIADCNDDGCGDPPMVGGPSAMSFPVTNGQCYKLRIGGFNDESGQGQADVTTTAGVQCPNGAVTLVNPANNTVDARQPHPVNSTTPAQGITSFMVTGPAGADNSCWSVCETASSGTPNSIASVNANGTSYTINLSRPITAGAVTSLSYNGTAAGRVFSHPGNVNGDSTAAPTDILRVIDCLNNINPGTACPWGMFSRDIDQSNAFGPADILRVIDLLNGADAFIVWNNTPLPSTAGCP